MAEARFNENLYSFNPSLGGCGLIGFCDSFYYERHSRDCAPGKWRVGVVGSEAGEFWPLLDRDMQAVVDDFGNLVPVGVQ